MTMQAFFSSGHVVDLILAIIVVEYGVLAWGGRGLGFRAGLLDRLLALAPGVCLLLALRAALTGAAWPWVAAWLTASLPLHLVDAIRRRP
jgi:hypothetical protein